MGCNWYELTGVYFDGRQQEKELVMVMCKVDKFEGKKWWHKQKKVCIDCNVVSNFFPRGLYMEINGKITVVRGRIASASFLKRDNFCDFLFAFHNTKSHLKSGLLSLGANSFILEWTVHLRHFGSKFFHFRVDHFSEGQEQFYRVVYLDCVLIPLNSIPFWYPYKKYL